MQSLILKYRPQDWPDIVGQRHIVDSLKSVVAKRRNHAFLLVGPSGVGKTTIARIIASKLGCTKNNLIEVDAATNSGIDAMRTITESVQYSGLGENPTRFVIVDEIHAASRQAFQALLKPIEEPPANTFWALCTTEVLKVPKAIVTRCAAYTLKPVDADDLYDLLVKVRDAEGLEASDEVLQLISRKSDGSPRQALSSLAKCAKCRDRKEAGKLIPVVEGGSEGVIEICRGLMKGQLTWDRAMILCQAIKDENPESLRQVTLSYFTKVALGTKDSERAGYILTVLSAFSETYPSGAGFGSFLLSLGRVLLTD